MKKKLLLLLISMFLFVNCASGTNPYFTNRNVGIALGGAGGATAGAVLGKNLKGVGKVAAIGGGALLGALLLGKGGDMMDTADQNRQVELIERVLNNSRDGQTTEHTYTKQIPNPQTGVMESQIIRQRVMPRRTYSQPQYQYQTNNEIGCEVGCRGNENEKWKRYTYTQPHQYPNNQYVCREVEVSISIDQQGAPPSQQTFTRFCKTESGWKMQ
jgi:hypothetical protein